jgi:SGNH domain-containing protein
VTPWLCTTSNCPVVVDNPLAYHDDNHLSTPFATWLAPLLGFQLDQTIRAGHQVAATGPGHTLGSLTAPAHLQRLSGSSAASITDLADPSA